jgi:hypothetical protein
MHHRESCDDLWFEIMVVLSQSMAEGMDLQTSEMGSQHGCKTWPSAHGKLLDQTQKRLRACFSWSIETSSCRHSMWLHPVKLKPLLDLFRNPCLFDVIAWTCPNNNLKLFYIKHFYSFYIIQSTNDVSELDVFGYPSKFISAIAVVN